MAALKQNFNSVNVINPYEQAQKSLASVGTLMTNAADITARKEAAAAREAALALQADRYAKADAQQALTNDRNGVIDRNAADKLALEKAQRAALVSMANEPAYSQRMGVDQTATDKQFRGIYGQEGEKLAPSAAFNAIIAKHPSREYDTKSPTFKADYAEEQAKQWGAYNASPEGQREFARNAAIQAQYEKLRPTQEAAEVALTSIGMNSGGDPTQVASLATKLASGYESTKALEAEAQKMSERDRSLKEMLFKEEMKTYNKGIFNKHGNGSTGTSSTATVATKWPELYAKIVNMQGDYGAGDANDLLTMAKKFEASGKTSGVKTTPQQFLNSLNRSTTAGRFPIIGDKKAYTDSNIKEALVKELTRGDAISTPRTLPTLKQERSASDYLREVKDSREKLRSEEFAAMAKKYPANGSTEPSTPVANGSTVVVPPKAPIKVTGAVGGQTSFNSTDGNNSISSAADITQEGLVNELNATAKDSSGMSTASIKSTDTNGELLPDGIQRIGNRYFRVVDSATNSSVAENYGNVRPATNTTLQDVLRDNKGTSITPFKHTLPGMTAGEQELYYSMKNADNTEKADSLINAKKDALIKYTNSLTSPEGLDTATNDAINLVIGAGGVGVSNVMANLFKNVSKVQLARRTAKIIAEETARLTPQRLRGLSKRGYSASTKERADIAKKAADKVKQEAEEAVKANDYSKFADKL